MPNNNSKVLRWSHHSFNNSTADYSLYHTNLLSVRHVCVTDWAAESKAACRFFIRPNSRDWLWFQIDVNELMAVPLWNQIELDGSHTLQNLSIHPSTVQSRLSFAGTGVRAHHRETKHFYSLFSHFCPYVNVCELREETGASRGNPGRHRENMHTHEHRICTCPIERICFKPRTFLLWSKR